MVADASLRLVRTLWTHKSSPEEHKHRGEERPLTSSGTGRVYTLINSFLSCDEDVVRSGKLQNVAVRSKFHLACQLDGAEELLC